MIRVLVAEDSPTARDLLLHVLSGDPDIQVVGVARDGIEAVEMARALRPDLVTMDIQMPRMDGLEATKEIMITAPTPIVIVTGSHRVRELGATMDALRLGALDVLEKPPALNAPGFTAASQRLVSAVKAMSQVKVVRHWRRPASEPIPVALPISQKPPSGVRGEIVAIAASTGGPAALQRLLAELPAGFSTPILAVQHITPGFAAGLANWLNTVSPLRVKVARDGDPLAERTVYIAPDGHHLGVSDQRSIALSDAPPIGGFRPSGTFLFTAVARVYGASALAVILTGMGNDGLEGLRDIRRSGGRIIAQDEPTSVVFGMPGAAIEAGLTQAVLPIDEIAPRLASWVC